MRSKRLLFASVSVVLCFWTRPNALALQGSLYSAPCGSAGTFLTNLGVKPVYFDLGLSLGGFSSCTFTLSWTDASGHPQTITVPLTAPTQGVSSTLAAGGVISWTTGSGTDTAQIVWRLERPRTALVAAPLKLAPATSATFGSLGGGTNLSCGESGTLYTNLTSSPVNFDLSLSNSSQQPSSACTITVSWSDASGKPQTITLGAGLSQGFFSTSLPAGGAISWTSPASANTGLGWELERAHQVVLVPPF